jgi:hypothetical protein
LLFSLYLLFSLLLQLVVAQVIANGATRTTEALLGTPKASTNGDNFSKRIQ